MKGWCVYMLLCSDGSLYTGASNDISSRLVTHQSGKGARYTRGRGPLHLVYCEPCSDRSEALRLEARMKRLRASEKRSLCAVPVLEGEALKDCLAG